MSFFKGIWKPNAKHRKLPEEVALQGIIKNKEKDTAKNVETESDTAVFRVKYLGSSCIEKSNSNNIASESVKSIMKEIISSKRKPQRVTLTISSKGVELKDQSAKEIVKISIYNISNCSTDPVYKCVFSFISIDEFETTSCHSFLCSKRKTAESATLAVAHVFSKAYEAWRILPSTKEFLEDVKHREKRVSESTNSCYEEKLIDFDEPVCETSKIRLNSTGSDWVSFEEDSDDDDFFAPDRKSVV